MTTIVGNSSAAATGTEQPRQNDANPESAAIFQQTVGATEKIEALDTPQKNGIASPSEGNNTPYLIAEDDSRGSGRFETVAL